MPKGKELSAEEKAKREAAKADKFKELASKRVNNALAAIANLKGLGNRNNYSYTQEQVEKMAAAFEAELKATFAYFAPNAEVKKDGGFSL